MAGTAFVYGTLMADEVVQSLIKRIPDSKPAVLDDYTRCRIEGRAYPAIIASNGECVNGKVLLDLSEEEMASLDGVWRVYEEGGGAAEGRGEVGPGVEATYETSEYIRTEVAPFLEDGTELHAFAYVWMEEYRCARTPGACLFPMRDRTMPGTAFVYGTLMADEVVKTLIHRVPASKKAVLADYVRCKVQHQVFPAIVASNGARVEGKVLLDLSDKELEILD
ncbi:AIG2-like protein, partial [Tetrabaena socialis]